MIPQWNQPSMCIPKMVSSNFTGVHRVLITTNQINGRRQQEFLHRQSSFMSQESPRTFAHTRLALHCRSQAKIIRMNSIKNFPVTTEDIDLTEKIYGPDVLSLKHKTVCQSPAPIVSDVIEVPREQITSQYNVDLCIDTMSVNSLAFWTAVFHSLLFQANTCNIH